MTIFLIIVSIVLGYLFGSIPFGWIIVKITSGQDIREVGSGRTGGTNVSRAAGLWAGVLTALLDIFKVTFAVLVATWLTGGISEAPRTWNRKKGMTEPAGSGEISKEMEPKKGRSSEQQELQTKRNYRSIPELIPSVKMPTAWSRQEGATSAFRSKT